MPKDFPPRGFTLVELLVAISLVLIISSFGLAYYSDFNRRQIVDQATKKIVSDIRLAQNLTLAQQKPSEDCGCVKLRGYIFKVRDTNSYKITADCWKGGPNPSLCSENVKLVVLEGVSIAWLDSIEFLVLTQGVAITPSDSNSIKVESLVSSYSRKIIIGPSGDLTIQ